MNPAVVEDMVRIGVIITMFGASWAFDYWWSLTHWSVIP